MSKKFIVFGDIEIEKHKFSRHNNPIFQNDVDIQNILIPKMICPSERLLFCLFAEFYKPSIKPF